MDLFILCCVMLFICCAVEFVLRRNHCSSYFLCNMGTVLAFCMGATYFSAIGVSLGITMLFASIALHFIQPFNQSHKLRAALMILQLLSVAYLLMPVQPLLWFLCADWTAVVGYLAFSLARDFKHDMRLAFLL
ncbi:MAG: hypothetical protein K2W82_17780 [Candidatus Obscuribacterales bacterium]|nr:hypothetical protein [Candidatus Obscuribacterales bacterium]